MTMPHFALDFPFWILAVLAALAGLAALWLVARARAPNKAAEKTYVARLRGLAQKGGWFGRLMEALVYLFTSREQRYERPWTLLLGEKGAGKTSLLRSVAAHLRHDPPAWAERIELPGAEWVLFEHGVLIDPEGRLCDTRGEGNNSGGKGWHTLLDKIDDLRPERPLDKVILAVSARSLLAHGEDALLDLARDALRQLQEVQHRFEFAVPVYVVVTQCDAVPGFSAFWRAQATARRDEIFGWTAPPAFQSEEPSAWVETAFASLCQRLRQIVLTVSAKAPVDTGKRHGTPAPSPLTPPPAGEGDVGSRARDSQAEAQELDRFFLFPVSFRRLQAPMARWFAEVFQSSDWGESFFCRGIYFSGDVAADGAGMEGPRGDVDFLHGLLADRVFAEPHMALPTRKRVWSRNRLIRRAQIAALAVLIALFAALGVSSWRLSQQMRDVDTAMHTLREMRSTANAEDCLDVGGFHALLRQVARIDAHSTYAAIPLSWVDDRALRYGAEEISNASLEKVVMPAVSCRLAHKARALLESAAAPVVADANAVADPLATPRRAFLDYLAAVRALEDNLARFLVASRFANEDDKETSLRLFADLAAYAYDQPLPKAVLTQRGALPASLARITFNASVPLPRDARERYAQRIEALAADLRATLERELAVGPALLATLEHPAATAGGDSRGETTHLVWWLNWMRNSWLGSTAANNPCESIRGAGRQQLADLIGRHGYPQRLGSLADTFGDALCYQPAMRTLADLRIAPHGLMFGPRGGVLELNPALAAEFAGLGALMNLDYMRLTPHQGFQCQADSAGWNPAVLMEATGYARKYMEFAKARGLPSSGAAPARRPLYDRLAREQLEAVLNDRLRAAQWAAATPALGGVNDLSEAERRLARESADFAAATAPLLEVLNLYQQLGFTAAAQQVASCARGQADDSLRRVQTLADNSRLYDLELDGGAEARMPGDLAQTKDWLARQVARARVLATYASQYLAFLKNSREGGDSLTVDAKSATFWNNSLDELERYLQFKEPNGQVAALHNLFIKTLPGEAGKGMGEGCRQRLAAYEPPEYGYDLFSQLRRQSLEQARWNCSERPNAAAFASWRRLSDRFNRELAGRYPFGPLSGPDAAPGVVRAFLADYEAQAGALSAAFDGMKQPEWTAARRFLTQMDGVAAFFRNTLSVEPAAGPVQIGVEFNTLAKASPGANQIVNWALSSGAVSAAFPNRPSSLEWAWGQPLELVLTWASGSQWRPLADPTQADLLVNGATASYVGEGTWALLRLIQRHRAASPADPLAPGRIVLAFDVPILATTTPAGQASRGNARPHIALTLTAKDAKTGAVGALRLPLIPGLAPGNNKE